MPPVETVYQLILLPAETAERFELCVGIMAEGDAVAKVGAGSPALTVTVVVTLFVHPLMLV